MRMRARIKRLEREAARRSYRPATREDAVAWTRRFVAADPHHADVIDAIRTWGRAHGVDWIGAWRTEELHVGEYAKTVMMVPLRMLHNAQVQPRGHEQTGIALAKRLVPLLHDYQTGGDVFPLPQTYLVDWFAGPAGEQHVHGMLAACEIAERRLRDVAAGAA